MNSYLGDFLHGQAIHFKWATFAIAGESITRATNGSIRIYRDDGATERASAAGITDTEDFDGLTGVHHLKVDSADDTDAGFYAPGHDYQAVLVGAVVDGKTLNVPICSWSIENRGQYKVVKSGAITGGSTTEAVLSGGSATNDAYNNLGIRVWHVNGTVEFRAITDYVGGTATANFDAMLTACANGDRYDLIMGAAVAISGTPDVNLAQIGGNTSRQTQFGRGVDNILTGVVTETGFAPTTTQCRAVLSATLGNSSNIVGRDSYWRTGGLNHHKARISAVELVSGTTYLFTFAVAMPQAPAGDNEFEVL